MGNYGIYTDFFGFKTNLPIGVAAGTIHNIRYMEASMKDGFEVLTWKTLRSEKRIAHRNNGSYLGHNIVFVDATKIEKKYIGSKIVARKKTSNNPENITITNSVGMPSPEPYEWAYMLKQGQKLSEKFKKQTITSVVGTAKKDDDIYSLAKDYAFVARLAEASGENIIEVNLSCPNVSGKEGVIYKDIKSSKIILKTIREFLRNENTKILAKLGYADRIFYEKFLKAVNEYIDGVVAINTIPMKVVDPRGRQALPGGLVSGTCGSAILDRAINAVSYLVDARDRLGISKKDLKIIGCGGVNTPESFIKHIDAGAEFVMVATASLFNPKLPLDIAKYINKAKIKINI